MEKDADNESLGKPKVDLDKVLVEVGQFGKFQIMIIFQCIVCVIFASWNINEFVFMAGRIETRCVIPECEDPIQTEFSPTWIANAVPWSGGSMDNCQRYGNTSLASPADGTCPAALFDTSMRQQCEGYLYNNTNTIVYDFGLACDEWRRALVGTVRIGGMMVALAVTGYTSDRWGRRRALAINAFCSAVMGITRYWAPSYQVYMALLFIESAVGCGAFSCAYVIMVELLGARYRVVGAALTNASFALGMTTLGLIAWVVHYWRHLILALYIPQLFTMLHFWTMTESLRWLMTKGRYEESENILKRAARVNGKEISQKSLDDLRLNAEEDKVRNSDVKSSLVAFVLKDKGILVRCIVTCFWWISATFVYYGLSINSVNLTGNMYLNYVVASIIEFPGFVTMVLIIDRIGRKPTVIGGFWICAACQVAFIFISSDQTVLSLIVYMAGKWAIAIVMPSLNIFNLELFPTECRHRMYAFANMVGRIGSMVAPLSPTLGIIFFEELPFILFGGMAFLAGLATFLVPETLGSKMADTMDQTLSNQNRETK